MKNLKNKKGFTIVELVIVIAVIAILAAVLIPTFGGVIQRANDSKVIQEARNKYVNYLTLDGNESKANQDFVIAVELNDTTTKYVAYNNGALVNTVYATQAEAVVAAQVNLPEGVTEAVANTHYILIPAE